MEIKLEQWGYQYCGASRWHQPDQQKKNEIDSLLSEAMTTLTFEEQQEQLKVLHGVAHPIKKAGTPTLIVNTLRQLDDCLKAAK